ncbi:hypothetical protein [Alteromonas lipotrueae]|uniref:hypothetical protein n=1 Tax=Alteromonas lipotrueae TaxID=2803814 RepID=UPI001C47FD5B|nr:hypothetical protein [Alteromonas lipotrueae]
MKIILFILVAFYNCTVDASCTQNSCDTSIARLYLSGTSDGRVFIEPSEVASGVVNCELAEGKFFTLYQSHPLFSEIYSTLLASKIASRSVRLRIHENTLDCKLLYIWLK